MTDGLRKSHLRKAPQVGLSEVGLPESNQNYIFSSPNSTKICVFSPKVKTLILDLYSNYSDISAV